MTSTLSPPGSAAPNGHLPAATGGFNLPRPPHLPPRRRLIPLLVIAFVLLALTLWLLRPAAAHGPLTASGTVEVDEVTLSAEAPGRIVALAVDEGNHIAAGQLVGRLTDPVLEVQLKQTTVDAAQQQLYQAQMSRLELHSPLTGIVQKRIAHQGEFVAAGSPILTVADPTTLKLTLYVLEAELGRVAVGQSVGIRADAFSDRLFAGRVQTIANHAEFTPRNVSTRADRQNLVFAVTVRVPNPDSALKAGLPVDATFDQ